MIVLCIYTMVVHFVAVLFTGFIVYTAQPGSSLFSWHPTLMTVAFALLMFEAILVFSPQSSLIGKTTRAVKVQFHGLLQTCGAVCGGLGLAAIVYNKELGEKPHFKSWHGLLGIITASYVAVQCIAGAFVKYPSLARGLKPAQLKLYHATSGLCLFSLVCTTLVLGLFTNWFTHEVQGTPWYACVASVAILILAVMNQVVNAYLPRTTTTAHKPR